MRGTVVLFSAPKGFGFLKGMDGKDVFCHFTALQMDGYKALKPGQDVEFEIVAGEKGPQAADVVVLEKE